MNLIRIKEQTIDDFIGHMKFRHIGHSYLDKLPYLPLPQLSEEHIKKLLKTTDFKELATNCVELYYRTIHFVPIYSPNEYDYSQVFHSNKYFSKKYIDNVIVPFNEYYGLGEYFYDIIAKFNYVFVTYHQNLDEYEDFWLKIE